MKTNIRGDIFHLAKCVLIFFIILLFQSCASTSTSVKGLEGSDFNENLPGLWEGKWSAGGYSGKQHIKIIKEDRVWTIHKQRLSAAGISVSALRIPLFF